MNEPAESRPDPKRPDDPEQLRGLDPGALLRGALADDPEAEAAFEAELREEIARRLPDLEVLACLGRGGMGTVFRVRQRRVDRIAALKVLTPRDEQVAGLVGRFEREARTLARLVHPGIVALYEFGRQDDFCWLLMECVEGATLRQQLAAGPLPPLRALELASALCEALQYAHADGVVHRDIKPENVLIDLAGRPKIADFGLAKLLGEPAVLVSLSASRQVLGTLRYMAPEQIDAPREVDHRADLYALGVVIYEMLTGEVPVGRFELPSSRGLAPLQLDDLVVRSLERRPARRYQHASEVHSAVDSVRERIVSDAAGSGRSAGRKPNISRAARVALALCVSAWGQVLATLALIYVGVVGQARFEAVEEQELRLSTIELWWRRLSEDLDVIALIGALLSLAFAASASVAGWNALRELRRDWPRKTGIGAALTAMWFLPYALGYATLACFVYLPIEAFGAASAWLIALIALAAPIGYVALVVLQRRRMLAELARRT